MSGKERASREDEWAKLAKAWKKRAEGAEVKVALLVTERTGLRQALEQACNILEKSKNPSERIAAMSMRGFLK